MCSTSFSISSCLAIDVRALIDAGQKAGLPVLRFLDRIAAGAHGDERRQILVLRAQAVSEPRAHAGADQPGLAAIHQQQRRLVIRHVGVHRADDADVVDALATCGNISLTSMPLWPYFWNLNGEGNAAPVFRSVGRLASAIPCPRIWPAPAWDRTYRRATGRR